MQALAFLAVFVYATHAKQAIAFEWKPGLRVSPDDVTSGILVEIGNMEGLLSGHREDMEMRRSSRGVASLSVTPPPGLQAIYNECSRIYPDQPNPLQVTAVVKYWYSLLYSFSLVFV